MKKLSIISMSTLLKRIGFILLFPLFLFSYSIKWAPIMMGDITTFVPYTDVTLSLGANRTIQGDEDSVIVADVTHTDEIERFEWREGNNVVGTGMTFATTELSVGTHTLTLVAILANGMTVEDDITIVIKAESTDEQNNGYNGGFVGTTKGTFSVNKGTASYSLKIDVPPGVSGMEPKLSLNYTSAGGNGYMGVGWNIGGVSAITRCPQTKATDGANHKFGVNYDVNDRFCLDGQRLILVSGTYGASGSEYRTEISNYSKIKAVGGNGSPTSFTVQTKSGLKYAYGVGNATQTTSFGYTEKFWKVSSIRDTYNNYIIFHYLADNGKGTHYLSRVTYAGNEIKYVYDNTRRDKIKGYQAGAAFAIEKRLNTVIVKVAGNEVRSYHIDYDEEVAGNSRSLLKSITEKVPGDTLKKLDFDWTDTSSNEDFSYSLSQSTAILANGDDSHGDNDSDNYPYIYTPDVNGDGLSDICYRSDQGIKCYVNNNGTFPTTPDISTGLCYNHDTSNGGCDNKNNYRTIRFADMNGDGLSDLVYRSDAGMRIWKSTGSGFTYLSGNTILANADDYYGNNDTNNWEYIYTPDYNGDGKLDICYRSDRGINCYANQGDAEFTSYPTVTTSICKDYSSDDNGNEGYCISDNEYSTIRFVDMDADGRSDILYRSKKGIRIWKSTGTGFNLTTQSSVAKNPDGFEYVNLNFTFLHNIQTPDMNGDGLPDVCYRDTSGIKCYTNTGGTFSDTPTISTTICADRSQADGVCNDKDNYQTIQFVDTDADGLPELTYRSDAGLRIWKNTGNALASSPMTSSILVNYEDDFGNNDYDNWGTKAYFDIDGDGIQDFFYRSDQGIKIYKNRSNASLVTKIDNDTDQTIDITYKYMSDSSVYHNYSTHGRRNNYAWNNIANDNIEVTLPQALVYAVNTNNGIGGTNTLRYKYYGYVLNKIRGSQGFHAMITYDDTSQMYSTEYYKQIGVPGGVGFQYTGMPYAVIGGREYGGVSSEWLSYTSLIYSDAKQSSSKVYEPYTYSNIQKVYDPISKNLIKKITHFNTLSHDGLGNVENTIDKIEDVINTTEAKKTTINLYDSEDTSKWHIGRLTSSTVTHALTSKPSISRKSTFTYNDKGLLDKEIANVGTSQALTKRYTYTGHGNKKTESISGYGITSGTTHFYYDSAGKFQTSIKDAAGLQIHKTYDARFGTIKTLTDANANISRWEYDKLGRKTKETRPDGTTTTWSHEWVESSNNFIYANHALYTVGIHSSGQPFSRTYFDALARDVGSYTYSMRTASKPSPYDRRVSVKKEYNNKGELIKEELPHYTSSPVGTINTEYDTYGRVDKVTKTGPSNQSQIYTTSYSNFTQTTTDPKSVQKITVKNAQDQTLWTTDASNKSEASSITYSYDSAGNLLTTTDYENNVITMRYDTTGNKTYMNDPDLGVWNYTYNALGNLKTQWSGTSGYNYSKHSSYKSYDILGRVTRDMSYNRLEYNSNSSTYSYNQTNYLYYTSTATKGSKGKLRRTTSTSRIKGKGTQTQIINTRYDTLGRAKDSTTSINSRDYLSKTSYDRYSRPSTISYPNNYSTTNHYQNGILDQVIGSEGKVHYKVNGLNAFGEISDAKYANGVRTAIGYDTAGYIGSILSGKNNSYYSGNVQQVRYTYDSLGNVKTRNDNSISGKYINEAFTYDNMNRIRTLRTLSNVAGTYRKDKNYQYDKLGNMTYQSGIGTYQYTYGSPHALSHAGSRRYYYDTVGNMTTRNGDTITYNPINKPATMKKSGASSSQTVHFTYGAGNARYLKTVGNKQTYYLGKAYEEQIEGNERKQTVYIQLGGKTIGTHVVLIDDDYSINPSNPHYKQSYNNYFHTDALGSITSITNDVGTVVERRSYEPFGKIRAMNYGTNNNHSIENKVINTDRAFTGHEQISELSGLIHMNARVYDSDIGRFLSADTIIQDPHDSQAYNRYSYARNNPMMFTDPSGHSWWSDNEQKIKNIVIGVIVAILVVYTGGAILQLAGYGTIGAATAAGAYGAIVVAGAIGGAVGGFAAGMLNGATFDESLQMAGSGALYGGIGAGVASVIGSAWGASAGVGAKTGRALLHAMSRAAISKAQGGKWSAGFWSGFASSALGGQIASASSIEGQTAMAAIVGGTAAELGGGKFANGAVTGAFVHMYNYEAHGSVAMNRKRQALLASAKDGHLTLEEANTWYVYGKGKSVLVDGTKLKYELTGKTTSKGNYRANVTGKDWEVYGQVTVSSKSMGVMHDIYGFEMHGSPLRDFLTIIGRSVAGSVGTPYTIKPVYDGSWRNQ